MKKAIATALATAAMVVVTGCATSYPMGNIYTELRLPVAATSADLSDLKVGTASCRSILGMVATGDSSIQTAAKSAGITQIHHVDWEVKNILGVIQETTVIVYGE